MQKYLLAMSLAAVALYLGPKLVARMTCLAWAIIDAHQAVWEQSTRTACIGAIVGAIAAYIDGGGWIQASLFVFLSLAAGLFATIFSNGAAFALSKDKQKFNAMKMWYQIRMGQIESPFAGR